MKNILVAVDFSDSSINTLKYALLSNAGAQIHVVHAFEQKLDPIESIVDERRALEVSTKTSLKDFILKGVGYTQLPAHLKIHVVHGEAVHQIRKFVKDHHIDFVYIGSRDRYDFIDKWFGTTTLGAVRTVKVPVLVVPPHAGYSGYKRVLVASDERIVESAYLNKLKSWNKEHAAYIKFLHITQSAGDSFIDERAKIIEAFYEKEQMNFAYEIEVKQHGNVAEAVLKEAIEFRADLILNVSANQNYIQSLLFHSVTEELILNSKVPMLFWTHVK